MAVPFTSRLTRGCSPQRVERDPACQNVGINTICFVCKIKHVHDAMHAWAWGGSGKLSVERGRKILREGSWPTWANDPTDTRAHTHTRTRTHSGCVAWHYVPRRRSAGALTSAPGLVRPPRRRGAGAQWLLGRMHASNCVHKRTPARTYARSRHRHVSRLPMAMSDCAHLLVRVPHPRQHHRHCLRRMPRWDVRWTHGCARASLFVVWALRCKIKAETIPSSAASYNLDLVFLRLKQNNWHQSMKYLVD